MCLIIDVNVAREVFSKTEDIDFVVIRNALFQSKSNNTIKIVYGGHLRTEYLRIEDVRRALRVLDQAGRARVVPDTKVNAEQAEVETLNLCTSNDTHIIALARVGSVRLLCSRDQALHTDFNNKNLIDNPRGKVYQNASHVHLIRRFCR